MARAALAAKPADDEHAYGHAKAEYFSAGIEGTLILVAAVSIAVHRGRAPPAPAADRTVGLGLAVSVRRVG